MKKDVVKLLADTAARSGISHRDLAREVFGNDDRASIKKVSSRLNSGEGLDLDELPAFVAALQIAPDELLRAMLPGLPDTRSLIVEKRKSDMRVRTLKAQLAATIDSVDLSLVEEITSSGRWTVGMLPYTCGPSRETEVLSSIRLAVTPTRPDIVEPGATVRSQFVAEFGRILGDRAWFLGRVAKPLPEPAIQADPRDVVHLVIPVFHADRPPSPAAVPLPRIPGGAVLVTAVTANAWAAIVAAIVGRAIGWGVEDASTAGWVSTPILDNDLYRYIDQMNKIRNDGVRSSLLAPPPTTVLHHVGRPVLDSKGEVYENNALVDLIGAGLADQLPFVVLLTESDRMIAHQEHKVIRFDTGQPKYSTQEWTRWRDEVLSVVEILEQRRRAMVVHLDFPWEPQNEIDSPPDDVATANRLVWQRSAKVAWKIVERLLEWGAIGQKWLPRNIDQEAERILGSQSLYR